MLHAVALSGAGDSACGVELRGDDGLGFVDTIDCPACRAIVARERAALDMPPVGYPLPSTPFYAAMAQGHLSRKGHALVAVLTSTDGELWNLERSCCSGRA